ncbi:putative ribonuclease H-like domain-containing protein [Tanacetum coccineum]
MMTQKLGNGFEFIKKACFVCGSFNHLIKDCDFHDNKMVEKPVLNNKGRVTGQREIRPVWNNAQRVNHQNKLTHPHPKRNFVPTAVATKSGQVPVNVAKPVNTAAPKPKVNDALPTTYSYFKAHSPVRRAFNQKSAAKTNNFNEKVNTARVNNVTTVGPKAVVSAAGGNEENVGNPQYTLQDQRIFDSGCSRHMTGNKSFLVDYQEIDSGFVAFGGSPKGVVARNQTNRNTVANDAGKKTTEEPTNKGERNGQEKERGASNKEGDQNVQDLRAELDKLLVQQKEGYANSTNRVSTVNPSVSAAGQSFDNADDLSTDPLMHDLEDTTDLLNTGIFSGAYDDEDVGAEAGLNNLETTMNDRSNQEVYVCQPPGFEDPQFSDKVYKVEKALYGLHQAPRAWYETLSTYLLENRFRRVTIDKTLFIKKDKDDAQEIPDGFYGGAHFLLRVAVKTTSTPIKTNKALLKDEEADDVDVHLYRSMIGSLMYLTAFRPDIMFVVCACARFQVTPKVSHLHAVKRIFRYLKGQPKLGLWYPRDSPFELEAFFDSNYAGASLDRKSTTGDGISDEFGVKTDSCKVNVAGQDLVLLGEIVEGEGSGQPSEPQPPSSTAPPSPRKNNFPKMLQHLTHKKKPQTPRQAKRRDRTLRITQSGGSPLEKVRYEAVHKELGDIVERAATTAASLDAEQDSGYMWKSPGCQETMGYHSHTRSERVPTTLFLDSHPPRRVLALETSKTAQDLVINKLKKKVKRLEKKQRARTPGMKLFKIGTSKRKSSDKKNKQFITATTGVSTASASVTTAGVSIKLLLKPKHPTTTTTTYEDEIITIELKTLIQRDAEIPQRLFEEEQAQFEKEQRIAKERAAE